MGSRLRSRSSSSATTRQAAAASFCWLALPAVTVPSVDSGRSLASDSGVQSALIPSSREQTSGSPLLLRDLDGHDLLPESTIGPSRRRALMTARREEIRLGARYRRYSRARFSAVSGMPEI